MGAKQIRLKLEGPAVSPGTISLALLAEKLSALQTAFYSVASAMRGGGPRGRFSKYVVRECELRFVEAKSGSLEIVSELSEVSELEGTGLSIVADTIASFDAYVSAVSRGNQVDVIHVIPDAGGRARVAGALARLLPGPEDDYDVSINVNGNGSWTTLTAAARSVLAATAVQSVDEEDIDSVRSITGRLYRIEVETAERHVGVEFENRHIKCRYPDALEDTVSQFIAGSLVEVTGRAVVDNSGKIVEFVDIADIQEIEIRPALIRRVRHGGRTLMLSATLSVDVDYRSGLWTYDFPALGIIAYGYSRRTAMDRFREEFVEVWDYIGKASDDELTQDALDLKAKMIALGIREESEQ